ncbi:hypothetical protein VTL71DRAFT_6730 [Oculimacula yallundae]|uniref:Uncharacterized protein n=1 Tax=Oculimacula yallundae TaxID=86028 RepID=A0ABR4BZH2_9HELO
MLDMLPLVNLPWFITLHALGLSFLGLYQTFLIRPITPSGPPKGLSKPKIQTQPANPLLGIATLALGLAYLSTSYMPIEQNQFLHASVPIRIILAVVSIVRLVLDRNVGNLSGGEKRSLAVVAAYDGLGAVGLGLWLGTFGGKVAVL